MHKKFTEILPDLRYLSYLRKMWVLCKCSSITAVILNFCKWKLQLSCSHSCRCAWWWTASLHYGQPQHWNWSVAMRFNVSRTPAAFSTTNGPGVWDLKIFEAYPVDLCKCGLFGRVGLLLCSSCIAYIANMPTCQAQNCLFQCNYPTPWAESFKALVFPTPLRVIYQVSGCIAILHDLFGMVKWPFSMAMWRPTRGWKGHFESPGT